MRSAGPSPMDKHENSAQVHWFVTHDECKVMCSYLPVYDACACTRTLTYHFRVWVFPLSAFLIGFTLWKVEIVFYFVCLFVFAYVCTCISFQWAFNEYTYKTHTPFEFYEIEKDAMKSV